jgi:hypothetical protein
MASEEIQEGIDKHPSILKIPLVKKGKNEPVSILSPSCLHLVARLDHPHKGSTQLEASVPEPDLKLPSVSRIQLDTGIPSAQADQ